MMARKRRQVFYQPQSTGGAWGLSKCATVEVSSGGDLGVMGPSPASGSGLGVEPARDSNCRARPTYECDDLPEKLARRLQGGLQAARRQGLRRLLSGQERATSQMGERVGPPALQACRPEGPRTCQRTASPCHASRLLGNSWAPTCYLPFPRTQKWCDSCP